MFSGNFHARKSDNTEHAIDAAALPADSLVRSYFSPTDQPTLNAVIPLIDAASATLDVAMFYLTSDLIAQALLRAQARGVRVRMVLDASGAGNSCSKHTLLCSSGVDVKIENWGGKSHSKWAVADAGRPSAAVVLGSMNWTNAGDTDNDENTLYVKNADFASAFAAEFARQWADLGIVPSCTKVSVEGQDSSTCSSSGCHVSCTSGSCCDGIDNDYDAKQDLQDEACGCADGLDNDGDGYVDGADFECSRFEETSDP